MTEGTSQGLFVVVAIVIFGIFVGLAYTAFGSEGLSNDLKGIFEKSIEDASDNLQPIPFSGNLSNNLIKTSDFDESFITINELTNEYIIFSGEKGNDFGGLILRLEDIDVGSKYVFEYDLTILSGHLNSFGGHSTFIGGGDSETMYLNGKRIGSYYAGVSNYPYSIGETTKVRVDLRQARDLEKFTLYIQPNRKAYDTDYKVKVENITLRKVLEEN